MTFTQLEIFALVAELNSFTQAGLRLGISQSAVSHAVAALEEEWGVALFERQRGGVSLTDIGRQLVTRSREVVGLSATLRQEAAAARGLKRGTLRIGSFGPTSSIRLLPALLDAYRKQYPDIDVRVDEGSDQNVRAWLLDRRIDLGFVVLPDERFDTEPIAEDQMVVLLPPGHALAERERISLPALCAYPFIMTECGSCDLVEALFTAARLKPDTRHRSSQVLSVMALVARGEGWSILAELSLPPEPWSLPCVVRPLQPVARRRIGLAMLDASQASPAARAFVSLARRLRPHLVLDPSKHRAAHANAS